MKESLCRICLNDNNNMSSIFQKVANLKISNKIMSLAKVRIYPGDGLPDSICGMCISKLFNCIEFIEMCKKSDSRLRADHLNIKNSASENESCDDGSDGDITSLLQINCTDDLEIQATSDASNFLEENAAPVTVGSKITNKKKKCSKREKIKQQCNICGRVMSSRHRLNTHLVTHTDERPFACPFCNKKFSLETNLKVHLRVHTGEKPFECSLCGASFAQSSGLIAHKRKHTGQLPYKCMLCPRSFRTIGHLQYHTKRHTGETNFECDKCGRAFITRGELNQHTATHSGNRSHVCSVCGLRLTRASNLKRHMQRLHCALSISGDKESTLLLNTQKLDAFTEKD